MSKRINILIATAFLALFLAITSAKSENQQTANATPDSLQVVKHQNKFVDSIYLNLPCLKGHDDGANTLFKSGKITHKGQFTNWKLICGIQYVYDTAGFVATVKVYEEGIFTREVPIPKR